MSNPFHLYELAAKMYNTPHLITPDKGKIYSDILSRAIMVKGGMGGDGGDAVQQIQAFRPTENSDGSVNIHSPRASRFVGSTPIDTNGDPAPYVVTPEGTGIISIIGTLVHRGAWIGPSSGMVSYEGIKHQCATIGEDKLVKNVIFDLACPGGEAVGGFDCAGAIRALSAIKPTVAFVNGMAASGGYALASACRRIVSIPEGRTGSIGVYMMHVDFSAQLAMEGVKVTYIFAGDHKVDGNPYAALPEEVRVRFKGEIDEIYDMFVSCVVAGRGKRISEEAIRGTGALCYFGAEAKSLGLIDDVGTFEDLLVDMAQPETVSVVIDPGDDGGDGSNASSQPGAQPMNQGMPSVAAPEGTMSNPSLWSQFKAALGGGADEPAPAAATPPAAPPAPPAAAPPAATAPPPPAAVAPPATAPSVVHLLTGEASHIAGGQVSPRIDDVNCGTCLKGELTKIQGASATDKAAAIETAANAFVSAHCADIGKDGTDSMRALYVETAKSGDAAMLKNLETVAASFPKRTTARVDTSKAPSAEQVADLPSTGDVHLDALARVKSLGLREGTEEWATAYGKASADIKKERGVTSASA